MSIASILRALAEKRDRQRRLMIRQARSEAAKRGQSASIKRRADQARAMFGSN